MDNKKKAGIKALRPSTRRLIQLYSALLHNAYLKGFIDGEIYQGKAKTACVPGFNCYSCPGAVGACPLGSIQNALASTGHRAGWYVLGIILLFGVIAGRTICGWICPLGLIQELLHKIPTFKIRKSAVTRALTWLKYVFLAVFVVAIPLWYGFKEDIPFPGFCKYICPAGTFEGSVGLLSNPKNKDLYSLLGVFFTRKFIIMLVIVLACIFCYRSFCRFICPLGAIYGLFNRFSIAGVKVDKDLCNNCGACVRNCGMDVRHVGDHECIHCAKCIDSCAMKAISFKAGSVVLKAPASAKGPVENVKRKNAGRIAWGIALLVLCFALVWFNFLDPASKAGSGKGVDVNALSGVGSKPGMTLEDFTLTCLDGTEFKLEDKRGKVVMINLWATYCTPCVNELPYFNELYLKHKGEIEILAVHSSIVTDDPAAFLKDKGYTIPFAVDTTDNRLWTVVNGSSTLPQTIVLNKEGKVIYNQVGSVTPEVLEALYAKALEQ